MILFQQEMDGGQGSLFFLKPIATNLLHSAEETPSLTSNQYLPSRHPRTASISVLYNGPRDHDAARPR